MGPGRGSALGLVVVALLSTVARLFVTPDGVRAWRTGAEGERRTAALLAGLPSPPFVVLHDRRKPRSTANIDHLVIGPTGVWVIETKSYAGELRVRGGELWIGGRRKTAFVDQVQGQADAVSQALDGEAVTPLICVHRAGFPLVTRPVVGGVRIVKPSHLVEVIERATSVLSDDDLAKLTSLAETRLPSRAGSGQASRPYSVS